MNRRNRSHVVDFPLVLVIAIVIICCGGFAVIKGAGLFNETDYSACKVEDKDRTTNSGGESDARIYLVRSVQGGGRVDTRSV